MYAWIESQGIGCDDFVTHDKLDQCPSSLNKVHLNLEKIGSHRVFTSKHFLSQVIFASFQVLSKS